MAKRKPTHLYLFCVALVVLAGYCLAWKQCQISTDSHEYLTISRQIQRGEPVDSVLRTPGYPALLALLFTLRGGEDMTLLLIVQAVLHLGTILLVALMGERLTGSRLIGTLAGGSLLLPNFTLGVPSVLTEELAVFLLAATVFTLHAATGHRSPAASALLSALAGGLAISLALTRPAYQLLGPLLLLVVGGMLMRSHGVRQGSRAAALAVGPFFLVLSLGVGTWSARNERVHGFRGLTNAAGFHLTTRTIPYLERASDEFKTEREILIGVRDRQLVRRGSAHTGLMSAWSASDALMVATGKDLAGVSNRLLAMNKELILGSPLQYLNEVGFSAVRYWMPPTVRGLMPESRILQIPYLLLHGVYAAGVLYLAAMALALPFLAPQMVARQPLERRLLWAMLGIAALYAWGLTCLVETGGPRHRTPTDFCWLLLIAGIFPVVREVRARLRKGEPESLVEAPDGVTAATEPVATHRERALQLTA